MALRNYERLFLFEFMVHEVSYDAAKAMDVNFLKSLGPSIVTFLSDSFPSLEICEDEGGVGGPYNPYKVSFKSGKSCLFALGKGYVQSVNDKVRIEVCRKLPAGGCVPIFKFGTAYLKISKEFLSVLEAPCACSKCIKVSLDVRNDDLVSTGTIEVFLRLTHFGTAVFTQFQADSTIDSRSFAFRGDTQLGFYSPPPGENTTPQADAQIQRNSPIGGNINNDLLIDLLRALSATLMNFISNDAIAQQKDIRRLGYNAFHSAAHLGRPYMTPMLPQYTNPMLPQPYNPYNVSKYPQLPCSNQNRMVEQFVAPTPQFEGYPQNPPSNSSPINRSAIGDVLSENILTRPEWRTRRSESKMKQSSSEYKNCPPNKPSNKSPDVWYNVGDISEILKFIQN